MAQNLPFWQFSDQAGIDDDLFHTPVKVFISFKEIYFSFRVSRARCVKRAMQAMNVP